MCVLFAGLPGVLPVPALLMLPVFWDAWRSLPTTEPEDFYNLLFVMASCILAVTFACTMFVVHFSSCGFIYTIFNQSIFPQIFAIDLFHLVLLPELVREKLS
jgi:hypothetical protein